MSRAIYPKRPVRAAVTVFFATSLVMAIGLIFDGLPADKWPWAFGYCALLAVTTVGLMRNGRKALLLLVGAAAVAFVPAVIGFARLSATSDLEKGSHWIWLRVSVYLLYALSLPALWLVIRGWLLYRSDSFGSGSTGASDVT